MKTLLILLRKELIIFRSNKFLPKIAFIFPCMVILVVPLLATMDVRHVNIEVVNNDNSELSRQIITDLEATSMFHISMTSNYTEAIEAVEEGTADVVLEIPTNFQRDIVNGHAQMPHVSANGVNGTKGMLGSKYVAESVMRSIAQYQDIAIPDNTAVTYFYNPTLEYRNFMIPALMIMLLIMLCGFLPTLNLVSEKESGTIEQMNVTPVKTGTFVLSKVIPYWIIGIIDLVLAMTIAELVYGLWPAGSLVALFLAALLFILVMSGMGIIIANFSTKMSQSMFLMMFVVLICILMSGLYTPISSMPKWAQWVTYAIPPRYFIEVIRSLYLKSTSISEMWPQYTALAAFAIAMNLIAALTYKKQS